MTTVEKTADKTPDRPIDKRRALGRGLDSLLPSGPRVVPNPSGLATGRGGDAHEPSPQTVTPQGTSVGDLDPQADRPDSVRHIALDQIDDNPHQTRAEFNK